MKKILLFIVLFSLLSSVMYSQKSDIQFIRESYNEAQEKIKHQKNDDIPQDNMKISVNQNMPAIGPQTIDYVFYFDLIFDEEKTEYIHSLNFATRQYNVAASVFSYEEFLYNADGELIFYFLKEENAYDEKTFELRLYYKDENLIKVLAKELKEGGNPDNPADYEVSLLSKNEVPSYFEDYKNGVIPLGKTIKSIYEKVDDSF